MDLNTDTTRETRIYNQPLYGFRGEFTLSNTVAVPYFATNIDIARLSNEIKTHEQVAPSLDQTYKLQELYQREIDIVRIEQDLIKNFLMDPNKIKFFNSLTVVLLPKDEGGKIIPDFVDFVDGADPAIPTEGIPFDKSFVDGNKIIFGGVQFVETKAAGISRLRWDSTRVDAVAVDGQHRLTAIRHWFDGYKEKSLNEVERKTTIPVIFLLLSEKAGFKKGQFTDRGIKTIAREIFTDLNKNAKNVDKATEIILDDRSLISRCARELVTEETCQEQGGKLPLSLVRWRDPNVRFDSDHYLNSLVHLNLIVEDLLDLPKLKSGMEKAEVLEFINDVGLKLGDSKNHQLFSESGLELKADYLENYVDPVTEEPNTPLTGVPSNYMNSAVSGFKERYAPWIVRILTEPTPYAELLDYSRKNHLIDGLFAQYLAQPSSHQNQLRKSLEASLGHDWYNREISLHQIAIGNSKSQSALGFGEQWMFKVVFQNAVLKLAKSIVIDTPKDEAERIGGIQDVINTINNLYDKALLYTKTPLDGHYGYLWTFISLNPVNPTIQASAASEKRIYALLSLWYFCDRYNLTQIKLLGDEWEELTSLERAKAFVKKMTQQNSLAEWAIACNSCKELLELFRKNATTIGGEDVTDADKDKIAHSRLYKILELAFIPTPGSLVVNPLGDHAPDNYDQTQNEEPNDLKI
jgi:hypothetical protein